MKQDKKPICPLCGESLVFSWVIRSGTSRTQVEFFCPIESCDYCFTRVI